MTGIQNNRQHHKKSLKIIYETKEAKLFQRNISQLFFYTLSKLRCHSLWFKEGVLWQKHSWQNKMKNMHIYIHFILICFLLLTDDGISNRSKISILHTIIIVIISRRIVFRVWFIREIKIQFISCQTETWTLLTIPRFLDYFELMHSQKYPNIFGIFSGDFVRNIWPFPSLVLLMMESYLYINVPSKIKYIIKFQAFPVNSLLNWKVYGRHIKWIFCSSINLLIPPLPI